MIQEKDKIIIPSEKQPDVNNCNTSQTTILIQILLNIGRKFGGSFETFDGHKTLKDALTCVGLCV